MMISDQLPLGSGSWPGRRAMSAKTLTSVVSTMTFLSLLLLPLIVDAGPWRSSTTIGGTTLPLVVAKNFNSRSISSLTSIPTFHGGASREESPRGGSTMPSDGEDENINRQVEAVDAVEDLEAANEVAIAENVAAASAVASTDVTKADNNDTASLEKAHHSHISKKRRRRKKEKLDGPHAMYAKKLKVGLLLNNVSCHQSFLILTFFDIPYFRIAITPIYDEK